MGLFNEVHVKCPMCRDGYVAVQFKGGGTECATYVDSVPEHKVEEVLGSVRKCRGCGGESEVLRAGLPCVALIATPWRD